MALGFAYLTVAPACESLEGLAPHVALAWLVFAERSGSHFWAPSLNWMAALSKLVGDNFMVPLLWALVAILHAPFLLLKVQRVFGDLPACVVGGFVSILLFDRAPHEIVLGVSCGLVAGLERIAWMKSTRVIVGG